jgi:hypothetical protein
MNASQKIIRTDIHRPSAIQPEDYFFIAIIYNDDMAWSYNAGSREILRKHMQQTGGKFSSHAHGGTCHICGAWAATVAYFWHKPSNCYIVTGQDCCEKLDEGHASEFRAVRDRRANWEQFKAGKAKAEGTLRDLGLSQAWEIFSAEEAPEDRYEEITIRDIVRRLVALGHITPAQENFLRGLVGRIEKRAEVAAQRAAEAEAASPVPVTDKRIQVTGEVVTLKEVEGNFGTTVKMLVKSLDGGWKVWGTRPDSLMGVERGEVVTFMARIEVSKDDPKFGFFSRPTKADIVDPAAE